MDTDFEPHQKAARLADQELGRKAIGNEPMFAFLGAVLSAVAVTLYQAIQFAGWDSPPSNILASIVVIVAGAGVGFLIAREKTTEHQKLVENLEQQLRKREQ